MVKRFIVILFLMASPFVCATTDKQSSQEILQAERNCGGTAVFLAAMSTVSYLFSIIWKNTDGCTTCCSHIKESEKLLLESKFYGGCACIAGALWLYKKKMRERQEKLETDMLHNMETHGNYGAWKQFVKETSVDTELQEETKNNV